MARARPESSAKSESVVRWRERTVKDFDRDYEAVDRAIEAVKVGYFFCEGCETKVPFTYPDLRAVNDAIRLKHEMSALRPRPDGDEGGGGLTVIRRIVAPGAEDAA